MFVLGVPSTLLSGPSQKHSLVGATAAGAQAWGTPVPRMEGRAPQASSAPEQLRGTRAAQAGHSPWSC